jgi:hypothetical protein
MVRPRELAKPPAPKGKTKAPPAARKRARDEDEDEDEDEEEDEEEEEDDEPTPKKAAKKPVKKRPRDEEDEEDDEDNEDDEDDEPTPKRAKKPVKKRPSRDEDEEDEDSRPSRSGGLYAGVTGSKPRAPKIEIGAYKVELVKIHESKGDDQTVAISTLKILECRNKSAKSHEYEEGKTEVVLIEVVQGGAKWVAQYGRERHVAMAMAFAGFDSSEGQDYVALDPKGYLLDGAAGIANRFSKKGVTILGRTAYVNVTKRGEGDDGTIYTQQAWSPDPDLEKIEAP